MSEKNTISPKSTKNEVLEAYNELLEQVKSAKKNEKQEEKLANQKKETVQAASKLTTDEIVKNLASLKLSIVKSLEDLEGRMLEEYKKFSTLQQAIQIQNQDLTDIHEIKRNADTLSVLLLAQKEKSIAFEAGIEKKRLDWVKEQREFEAEQKEKEELVKKTRQREEEEYQYQKKLLRQKEQDKYISEKQALEAELILKRKNLEEEFKTRETNLLAQEEELRFLKEKAATFPLELEQAIKNTEQAITERLIFKHDFETKLTQKEIEGERKLHHQMIAGLEAKVATLEAQIKHLNEKENQANLQVQDIAVKAIEGASRQRNFAVTEKLIETQNK